jgi:hypothetical protein
MLTEHVLWATGLDLLHYPERLYGSPSKLEKIPMLIPFVIQQSLSSLSHQLSSAQLNWRMQQNGTADAAPHHFPSWNIMTQCEALTPDQ